MSDLKEHIHFVGIGGVGMGTFAAALARMGYQVSGSDGQLYEPMKGVLESASITLYEGYSESRANEIHPHKVIIGNVIRKENPEAKAFIRKGARFLSFPEAVRTLLIDAKKSIVCAGTHGKTTTTSWISFLLKESGLNPSFLIGGVPLDLSSGCEIQETSEYCVLEGDEYDSSFFDKGPKFLHYHPWMVVLANIEFDHADIYRDLDHVKSSFEKLMALVPGNGYVLVRAEEKLAVEVAKMAVGRMQTFGKSSSALWRVTQVTETEEGFTFEVIFKNKSLGNFQTPLFGEHNLMNLLSGIACAINLGVPLEKIRSIVPKFRGAKRRQQIIQKQPYRIVDDFAHHPTEVMATLSAVRNRFKTGKVIALFEPRSATARRHHHQEGFQSAFAAADVVCICEPFQAQQLPDEERFSAGKLKQFLEIQGKEAHVFSSADDIASFVKKTAQTGDNVVIMSNGEFGKIQSKLLS